MIHCTSDEQEKSPYEAAYDGKFTGVNVTLVNYTCVSKIQLTVPRHVDFVRMMLAQFAYAIRTIVGVSTDNIHMARVHYLQQICPDGVPKLSEGKNLNSSQREEIRVSELIEKQSQKDPDATAICAWDGNWTYGELVCRASSVIHPRAAKEPMLVAFLAGAGSGGTARQDEKLFHAPTEEFRQEARDPVLPPHGVSLWLHVSRRPGPGS